ncbi:MAG: hypothetical protein ACM3MA_01020 [Acidobacteriota bacterium]
MTYTLNQHIIVTAVRFTEQFRLIPKRIELDGVSYDVEPEQQGENGIFHLVSDTRHFHVAEPTEDNDWRLVGISTTGPAIA